MTELSSGEDAEREECNAGPGVAQGKTNQGDMEKTYRSRRE